jgi:chromosomal replication initiation ATPase DnaA
MKQVGVSKRKTAQAHAVSMAQVVVAGAYGVALDEMRSRTRKREAQEARQIATYLARVVFGLGLRELARETGRSPGTAFHACKQVENRREKPEFDRTVDFLEHQLRAAAGVSL